MTLAKTRLERYPTFKSYRNNITYQYQLVVQPRSSSFERITFMNDFIFVFQLVLNRPTYNVNK